MNIEEYNEKNLNQCPRCWSFIHKSRSYCGMCGYVFDWVAYNALKWKMQIMAKLEDLDKKLEERDEVDKK